MSTPSDPSHPSSSQSIAELPSAELIPLYFEPDSPAERDLVLDTLLERQDENAQEFIRHASQHDDDPVVRHQALGVRLSWGETDALEQLCAAFWASEDDALARFILHILHARLPSALTDKFATEIATNFNDLLANAMLFIAICEFLDALAPRLIPALAQQSLSCWQNDPNLYGDDLFEALVLLVVRSETQMHQPLRSFVEQARQSSLFDDENIALMHEALNLLDGN